MPLDRRIVGDAADHDLVEIIDPQRTPTSEALEWSHGRPYDHPVADDADLLRRDAVDIDGIRCHGRRVRDNDIREPSDQRVDRAFERAEELLWVDVPAARDH